MIEAKILCDSVSEQGHRLTTFQLRYPKFIHGEFMTHRRFSRNASSSRAVPTAKLIAEVRDDALRAAPVWWGKNQPGMQAAEELDRVVAKHTLVNVDNEAYGVSDYAFARHLWRKAALDACAWAGALYEMGAHKQIVNRLLEPFSHINVVCTATEYMNFFGLRLDAAAQPEMRALAEAMWRAYGESKPTMIQVDGGWHLPFILEEDFNAAMEYSIATATLGHWAVLKRVSVARCARVSYASFFPGNKRSTLDEDLKLYEQLSGNGHWSPLEHQARPDYYAHQVDGGGWANAREHGNFTGWRQLRKSMPGEALAAIPKEYL